MRGRNFRILCTSCVVCLSLVVFFQSSLFSKQTLTTLSLVIPHEQEPYYADDVSSYRSRLVKEYEYKELLSSLSEEKRTELEQKFHRDLTIQYSKRPLLPPSVPLHHEWCLSYLDKPYNQTVSVLIVYYNEVPTLLMRTLTTIVHRTLPRYLVEIIVIDDCSDLDISEEIIEYSKSQRIPITFVKNDYNMGIARSRSKGMALARGDTIAILDSHMEVADLWLEPLLDVISSKPNAIAVPHIFMITESQYDNKLDIYRYVVQTLYSFGLITYSMVTLPQFEPWEHYPSSALLGGGIVAYKSTLQKFYPTPVITSSGSKWGVENNRLAYRIWMCGEGIFMNDCSQVIHPNGNDPFLGRYSDVNNFWENLQAESVAELVNFCDSPVEATSLIQKYTSIPAMMDLVRNMSREIRAEFNRHEVGCPHNYAFYQYSVYEGYLSYGRDQFQYVGMVSSVAHPISCLDIADGVKVILYGCRNTPVTLQDTQLISFTKNGAIMLSQAVGKCFDMAFNYTDGAPVMIYGCHAAHPVEGTPGEVQVFEFREAEQWIWNPASARCMTYMNIHEVGFYTCDPNNVDQRWTIKLAPWF